jgi:hypothetical protein
VSAVGAILYEMLAGRRPFAEAADIAGRCDVTQHTSRLGIAQVELDAIPRFRVAAERALRGAQATPVSVKYLKGRQVPAPKDDQRLACEHAAVEWFNVLKSSACDQVA